MYFGKFDRGHKRASYVQSANLLPAGGLDCNPTLKDEVLGVLKSNPATYEEMLAEHFARHLEALNDGM